jgi:hypothetical protein
METCEGVTILIHKFLTTSLNEDGLRKERDGLCLGIKHYKNVKAKNTMVLGPYISVWGLTYQFGGVLFAFPRLSGHFSCFWMYQILRILAWMWTGFWNDASLIYVWIQRWEFGTVACDTHAVIGAPNVRYLQLLYKFLLETFLWHSWLNVLMVGRIKSGKRESARLHVCQHNGTFRLNQWFRRHYVWVACNKVDVSPDDFVCVLLRNGMHVFANLTHLWIYLQLLHQAVKLVCVRQWHGIWVTLKYTQGLFNWKIWFLEMKYDLHSSYRPMFIDEYSGTGNSFAALFYSFSCLII